MYIFINFYIMNSFINFAQLGYNAYKKNEYENSINYFRIHLIDNNINNFLYYCNISIIYFKLNNYKNALTYNIISIRLNPNWYKSWNLLGLILNKLNKNKESTIAYRRSLELCN